jgi:predicted transcriptional regulator
MDLLISDKKLKRQDIFQKADMPQKYGYKLLSGESHTIDRDKLLRIFIAMNMTLKETQRALTLYGMPILYPKLKRDAIIIIALNKGISSVDTVNEWLIEHKEPALSRSAD